MITALVSLLVTIGWIVWATSRLKWSPFLVMLLAVFFLGLAVGVPLGELPELLKKGMGKTLGGIGLLIVFGSIIGVALEQSKATQSIAMKLLGTLQRLPLPFAVSFIGYFVSIPVFCDSAFVILSSLNNRLAEQSKTPPVALTIALSTGLFAPHVLIPPTPGPLAAAANLSLKNLFLLITFGGGLAFILVLIGGAYAYYLSKRLTYVAPTPVEVENATADLPAFSLAVTPILLPILLMATGTLLPFLTVGHTGIQQLFAFLSSPTIALCLGMCVGLALVEKTQRTKVIVKGIEVAAPILIITALGGTLGLALQQLPLSTWLGQAATNSHWGLLIPFAIAAIIKTAQGSSTVAIITTTAILFPLLAPLGLDNEMGKVWVILAVGAGSMTVSHANDSYFWIVTQMGELDIKTAYRRHTFATLLQGIFGLAIILLARAIEQHFFV